MGGATSVEVGDCMIDEWKEVAVLVGMYTARFKYCCITLPRPLARSREKPCRETRPSPVRAISNRGNDVLANSTMTSKP